MKGEGVRGLDSEGVESEGGRVKGEGVRGSNSEGVES